MYRCCLIGKQEHLLGKTDIESFKTQSMYLSQHIHNYITLQYYLPQVGQRCRERVMNVCLT